MNQHNLNTVKNKSILSAFSLFFQSSYSAVLGFTAFFILSFASGIEILGVYSTVLASLSFFNYITNLGLAAALIQKKQPSQTDYNTAFYIQFALVIIAISAGFFLTDVILSQYNDLPNNAVLIYQSLLVSFLIISLKTIPSVILEKSLEIYKSVIVQIVENSSFYLIIIVMVLLGYDELSIVVAVLVRATLGFFVMFALKPWVPSFSFSLESGKKLLSYGIPFQGNSFLALIKDDLLIMYLSAVIGFEKLGILSFAKKYAEIAVRMITDNLNRVAFPIFAQFQESTHYLQKSLSSVVQYGAMLLFPVIIGGIFSFDVFLHVVDLLIRPGYYDKWQSALFSFYFFSISTLFVSLTTPFINLFNALKKLKFSLTFMTIWTVLTWLMVPSGIALFDFHAVAVIFAIISLSFIFVLQKAKQFVHFDMQSSLHPVLMSTLYMSIFLLFVRLINFLYPFSSLALIVLLVVGGGVVYLTSLTNQIGVEKVKLLFLDVRQVVRRDTK